MIRLNPHREPKWFDLIPGVRVKVAPITTAMMLVARRDPAVRETAAAGNDTETEVAIGKALARLTILEWEGVGDEAGNAVAVTDENVGQLMDIWEIWMEWASKVLVTFVAMDAEKNGSALLPTGSSAGAETTVEPAPGSATSVPAP